MKKTKLNKTLIMGILNLTPDSFSDGGIYYKNINKALQRAREMVSEGADIIDIGGESTRPGAEPVSPAAELSRVLPVIQAVRAEIKHIPISIDSYKSVVVKEALKQGASMINSLGGFKFDKNLIKIAAEYKKPVIIYHIYGNPKTMQLVNNFSKNIIQEIYDFFEEQIDQGLKAGMTKNQFILDPGIGFGKKAGQNLQIIKNLSRFKKFGLPVAVGISRKSHLGIVLASELSLPVVPDPALRLEASLAETAVAVINGASIVRTHDISETKKFLTILDMLK